MVRCGMLSWYEGDDTLGTGYDRSTGMASQQGGITAVSRIPNSMEIFWIGGDGSVWMLFGMRV